jgi:hypothetical protein
MAFDTALTDAGCDAGVLSAPEALQDLSREPSPSRIGLGQAGRRPCRSGARDQPRTCFGRRHHIAGPFLATEEFEAGLFDAYDDDGDGLIGEAEIGDVGDDLGEAGLFGF